MVATASSVNATFYASGGLTAMLAQVGQFPPFFGRGSRLGAKSGVLISAAVVLVVANTVDLSAIASVGSACSLMIFVLVGAAGYRLRSETGANRRDHARGDRRHAVVLGFFVVDTFRNAPETFTAIVVIALLAIVLDVVWKHARGPLASATRARSSRRLARSSATPRTRRTSEGDRTAGDRAPPPLRAYRTRRRVSDCRPRGARPGARELAGLAGAEISATPTVVEISVGSLPHQRSYTLRVSPAVVDLDAIARLDALVQDVLDGRGDRRGPGRASPRSGTSRSSDLADPARGVRARRRGADSGARRRLARSDRRGRRRARRR